MSHDTQTMNADQAKTAVIDYLREHYDVQEPDEIVLKEFAQVMDEDGIPSFWIGYEVHHDQETPIRAGAFHGVAMQAGGFHLVQFVRI